ARVAGLAQAPPRLRAPPLPPHAGRLRRRPPLRAPPGSGGIGRPAPAPELAPGGGRCASLRERAGLAMTGGEGGGSHCEFTPREPDDALRSTLLSPPGRPVAHHAGIGRAGP